MASSSVLEPSLESVYLLRTGIATSLQLRLPDEMRAKAIAPLLAGVNQWATQIPAILDASNNPAAANLVFSIRKELFPPPLYYQSVLGIPTDKLPSEFQDFLTFTLRLIEAQKPDKEKPPPRVSFSSYYRRFATDSNLFISQAKRASRIKSKATVDDDSDIEVVGGSVSEPPSTSAPPPDDHVRLSF